MKILVIRHISWDKKNDEITEDGKKQIKEIIEKIRKININFRIIYSSPLKRTLYTAEKISEEFSIPIILENLLSQRKEKEGESFKNVYNRTKEFLKK
ncbi:hypothetical protein YN1_8480 [Nanoarchaeota archaeon]